MPMSKNLNLFTKNPYHCKYHLSDLQDLHFRGGFSQQIEGCIDLNGTSFKNKQGG